LDHDQLTPVDWDDLETLMKLLDPFKEVTMDLQGNIRGEKMNGAIFDVLPAMDMLLVGVRMRNMDECGMWTHAVNCRMR
jgi:hypothetical protein